MLHRQFHDFKDSYEDMNFTGPLLSTIRARTLIIHGDRDSLFDVTSQLKCIDQFQTATSGSRPTPAMHRTRIDCA